MRGSNVRRLPRRPPPAAPAPVVVQPGAPDWTLLVLVAAIVAVGVVAVHSATAVEAVREAETLTDQFGILIRQATSLGVGLIVMWMGARLHYRVLRSWVLPVAMAAVFVMLGLLLFPNPLRGEPGPGGVAYRWLLDGPLRFQPAELAKVVLIIFGANMLDRKAKQVVGRGLTGPFLVYGGVMGAAFLLILKEPDLGTAMVVAGTAYFMLWAAELDWKWLLFCFVTGVGGLFGAAYVSEYRWERILSWLDPWLDAHGDSYQAVQGLIALANGGVLGVGLGQGVQKLGYLPEKHTDFILAVIAEETGLVGAGFVLLLFGLIAWRGYAIAAQAPDRFSSLVAAGITSMLVFQTFLNVAVISGLFPVTGVPMPFVSYGGTSLIVNLAAVGLLLGISRFRGGSERAATGRNRFARAE